MEILLRTGLSNAVAALLLAVVVVAVACVWRRPAVLHALWLLVLVKLVTPPLVWLPEPWPEAADPAPAPGADAPGSPADPAPAGSRRPLADDPPADSPQPAGPPPAWDAVLMPVPEPEAAAPTGKSEEGGVRSEERTQPAPASLLTPHSSLLTSAPGPAAPWWVVAAFGAWLAGALAWYALALVRLGRFRRLLRHAAVAPESLRQRARRLAEKMGIRGRRPAVWLVPGRVAPMLWAAGGPPRILFPAGLLARTTPEQQDALLVHELAHLRRRDHWVRWLEFAAAGLYWWDPVLWFARRELREAEEQCCDAWVTSTLPAAGKAYATALLETLDFLSDAPPATPLLASGVGRVSDLKRRLTMIMSGTTPRSLGWRGVLAVLGPGALLLPLLPAWARGQAPAEPVPEKAPAVAVFKFPDADPLPPAPEDVEKAKEELKELEAQLAQKQAEVADLKAKIEAVRAKVGMADGPSDRRVVVEVDADVKHADLQDLLKKLQASPPGGATQVIVIDKASGKIIMEVKPPSPPTPPNPPNPPAFVPQYELRSDGTVWVVVPKAAPPTPPVPAPPAAADTDKRIDELEQRLKKILDEVEQLRKERKPTAPDGKSDPNQHSNGPAPEKNPFGNETPPKGNPAEDQAKKLAARRDALQAQLEDLKARLDLEKVGDATVEQAKAALAAAAADLKQAEARKEVVEASVKNGAARAAELDEAQADVAARRAALEVAKANLDKAAEDQKVREAETEAKVRAADAARQAAEERIQQLEEELRKLQDKTDDAPKKP